uniref:Programmed cell death protein 4 n=1 Tax=Rhabditophanes sp. KR3021 TaxID=114890 RepID=A0AC35TL02_9BILA
MSYSRSRCNSERFDDPEVLAEIQFAKDSGTDYNPDIEQTNGKRSRNNSTKSLEKPTFAKSPSKPRARKNSTKAEKKARSRGISGCSTKKSKSFSDDYEYGSDDIDHDSSEDYDSDGNDDYQCYKSDGEKQSIEMALVDYFSSLDQNIAVTELHPYMQTEDGAFKTLSKVIAYPLEHGDNTLYEAVSVLVNALLEEESKDDGEEMRETLLRSIEDILLNITDWILDCPKIKDLFAMFLARLALDGVFDARYLTTMRMKVNMVEEASDCIMKASTLVQNPDRLHDILPKLGEFRSLEVLSDEIGKILRDLAHGQSIEDTRVKLSALNVPMYKHEIVYQAALLSANENDKTITTLLGELITSMYLEKEISHYYVSSGLHRFFADIDGKQIKVCKEETKGFMNVLREHTVLEADEMIGCN